MPEEKLINSIILTVAGGAEIDPTLYIPSTGTVDGLTFGPDPPRFVDLFDDLCPPPPDCPDCPKVPKCAEGRGALFGIRVEQFGNDTYPGFRNRTTGESLATASHQWSASLDSL